MENTNYCKICCRTYCSLASLRKHIKDIHVDSKFFPCNLRDCSEVFSTEDILNEHIKINHSHMFYKRVYGCSEYIYKLKEYHENINDNNNDIFCCKICDKTFNSNLVLSRHMNCIHNICVAKTKINFKIKFKENNFKSK